MLVCPHCQFENPETHKFCQNCGRSLSKKACPTCNTLIPLEIEYCPECGSFTGRVWRAIVSLTDLILTDKGETASELPFFPQVLVNAEPLLTLSPPQEDQTQDAWAQGQFLDRQQRYQLLDAPQLIPGATEFEVRVLDCQPFLPSHLELHQAAEPDSPEPETEASETVTSSITYPYLKLQEQYPFLPLPKVHDAWEQDPMKVMLLEDRTHFPLLLDYCQREEVLPLQMLYWLREMVEHWIALQPEHYSQSLLQLNNLCIDPEDHLFCLKRLYPDDASHAPDLKDLGSLWQGLFEQTQRTQHGEIFLLCRDLEAGSLTSTDQLLTRIEVIANSVQTPAMGSSTTIAFPQESEAPMAESLSNQPEQELAAFTPPIEPSPPASETPDLELVETAEPLAEVPLQEASEPDDLPTVVLPMRLISIEDAGRTDIGRQRDHNEDCFYVQTEVQKMESPQGRTVSAKGLYILCDGMGGHASGEVASRLAVDTLQKYFQANWHDKLPDEATIRAGIEAANQAIFDRNQENSSFGSGRMGTTLLLMLLQDTQVAIAHVGDSRLYQFSRRRGLEQITVDHEVGQREIQRGVEPAIAYARPDAYQLTQALGPRDVNFINPDVKYLELNEDMLLLLCSDGLTDNDFLELHYQGLLEPVLSHQTELDQGLSRLIGQANQFNGHDNITTVVIRVRVRPNLTQAGLK